MHPSLPCQREWAAGWLLIGREPESHLHLGQAALALNLPPPPFLPVWLLVCPLRLLRMWLFTPFLPLMWSVQTRTQEDTRMLAMQSLNTQTHADQHRCKIRWNELPGALILAD